MLKRCQRALWTLPQVIVIGYSTLGLIVNWKVLRTGFGCLKSGNVACWDNIFVVFGL